MISLQDYHIIGSWLTLMGAVLLCRRLGFDLGTSFFGASLRTILQLLALGFALRSIKNIEGMIPTFFIFAGMTVFAAHAAWSRQRIKTRELYLRCLSTISICVWPVALGFMGLISGIGVFEQPLFAIPIFGLLLGSSLGATSLALQSLERISQDHNEEINALEALGANRWEARHRHYREVFRAAVTPILNSMSAVGVVSLPGVMVGQVLKGGDPMEAVRFQMLVLFLLAFVAITSSCLLVGLDCFSESVSPETESNKRRASTIKSRGRDDVAAIT